MRKSVSLAKTTVLLAAAIICTAGPAAAYAPTTALVSVSSTDVQGNHDSFHTSISADGRYIAFISAASNLVPDDTNNTPDVFVRDRLRGITTRVSVSSTGTQANELSLYASISADGRYISYMSYASNLVPDDTNGTSDVFVRDRLRGTTTRVNVSSAGAQADSGSGEASISGDGRYVSFSSNASDLVPDDTNNVPDIFVRDRLRGITTRVNISSTGAQANAYSYDSSISADGRYITHMSYASNLVPGDTNDNLDVFVHDRLRGITTRVSVSSTGAQANAYSYDSSISADGRCIAFMSYASNLVPGDTNDDLDVFVHDRLRGITTRVSVSSTGAQANSSSFTPAISADGRHIAYHSYASNLVPNDTNNDGDVFVRDWGCSF